MSRRMERVNVLLRQEISRIVTEELKDPRLARFVSVTHVESAPDLRTAKVFVSVLGNDEEKGSTLKALKSASGFIRRSIHRHLRLQSAPSVQFRLDESIEQGTELLKLIEAVSPAPDAGKA